LQKDATHTLRATVTPADAYQEVYWYSSDDSVANVNDSGMVTAKRGGAVTITARSAGGGQTEQCAVSVLRVPGLYEADDADPKTTGSINTMLTWIKNSGTANTTYTLVLGQDETITTALPTIGGGAGASYLNKNNITIILQTSGTPVTITKGGNFALFTLTGTASDNPKLIIESGITLKGLETGTNSFAVVSVGAYGYLEMREGSRITGNVSTSTTVGGGVNILANGEFKMLGGEIDNNKLTANNPKGGGVNNSGAFTMKGGKIHDNEAGIATSVMSYGGGVYSTGTFTFEGGEISGNKAMAANGANERRDASGGGVFIDGGTFTMTAASQTNPPLIKNNEASLGGGLVLTCAAIANRTTALIEGGIISGNKVSRAGAALLIAGSVDFTKTGGTIYGADAGENANGVLSGVTSNFPHTVHTIQVLSTVSQASGYVWTWLRYADGTHTSGGLSISKTFTNPSTNAISTEAGFVEDTEN
jgi:hypothetical protein